MDNSEVLDAPEVQPTDQNNPTDNTPVQDSGATVINNMYSSANKPKGSAPVVGENNHADSIANAAMSNDEAKQTYEYTGVKEKEFNDTIQTRTTLSNGQELAGEWGPEMKMDEAYKATDDSDYKWNKQATAMASLKYAQEESQARYESMQAKQEMDQAASQAWNQYFGAEYAARQTQDKMGWTGGQQTASDLQVAFLQAETASNMYTQDEMQKYGVETKLGIARMYAEAEQKTLALQYYQDAVDLAVKEAEQTGCYVPPEASEMFAQDKMAKEILNNPNATSEEKERAQRVLNATQKYYDEKGFTHWEVKDPETGKVVTKYYGIETLQYLTHLETVRNNKVNEELQDEANRINRSAAGAAWKNVEIARLNLEETKALRNAANATAIMELYNKGQATKQTWEGGTYKDDNGKTQKATGKTVIKTSEGNFVTWKDSTGGAHAAKVSGGKGTGLEAISEGSGGKNNKEG